jgi:hypothetical protein
MGNVVLDISMSLDGFVAGPNPTLEEPLGSNGQRLHETASRGNAPALAMGASSVR